MQRPASMSAKFRAIVTYSLIAVIVILGVGYIFVSRSTVTPLPGASGPSGNNPTVSGRATYQKVPNQVLFAVDSAGKPNISGDLTNIKQGDAGDCYFLAALMTVAARSPETILNMVHDNGNGTYTISFHSKYDGVPNPVTVTVNGDLPYRRDKPFENGIENIDGTDLSNAQDHDVHNGLYAITGQAGVDRNPGGPMTEVSFAQIAEDFDSGLITLGTSNSDGKLVSDHSYALLGVNSSDQTVVVGDPEGGQETLSFETFQSTNINQYIAIPAFP